MMKAKKLVVGLVVAVTLTLFAGAVHAQQLVVPPQEDPARIPVAWVVLPDLNVRSTGLRSRPALIARPGRRARATGT